MKKLFFLLLFCFNLKASDTLLIKYCVKSQWVYGFLVTESSRIVDDVLLVYTHPIAFLDIFKHPIDKPKYYHFVFPEPKK